MAEKEQATDKPEKKKAVTKKATKGAEKAKTPRETTPKTNKGHSWSGALALILIVALTLALSGAAYYYLLPYYQQTQSRFAQLDSRINSRLEMQQQAQGVLAEKVVQLQTELAKLRQRDTGWQVAEIEYLLHVAQYRRHLMQDRDGVHQALESVDRILRDMGLRWQPLREVLQKDLLALDGVKVADISGMAAELGAMSASLSTLSQLATREAEEKTEPASAASPAETRGQWQQSWERFKREMSRLVIIRQVERPAEPLLPPDQFYYLQQNLRLKLETARYALLRGEASTYVDALKDAKAWLQDYFAADNAQVEALVSRLDSLMAVNIRPQLPELAVQERFLRIKSQWAAEVVTP